MNKRKASADRNGRQKAPSRQPSMASVFVKNNSTPRRHPCPEKSPSTQNLQQLERKDSSKMVRVNKGVEVYLPKTRFSSQHGIRDTRSVSSPRIKSFPAEKIKKLENRSSFLPEPMAALIMHQNPRETGTTFVTPTSAEYFNNGEGDARIASKFLHQQQQPQQNVQNASQQQVTSRQAVHHIGQLNPNSDSTLVQQAGSHNQMHRPFVPNVPHGTTIREYSPRKTSTVIPITEPSAVCQNSQPVVVPSSVTETPLHSSGNNAGKLVEHGMIENVDKNVNDDSPPYSDQEKQPIGGRKAEMHRRIMQRQQKESQVRSNAFVDANSSGQFNENGQDVQYVQNNVYPGRFYVSSYGNHQNPQQAYQQYQENIAHQQGMQQHAMNQQLQMMNNRQYQMYGSQGGYYNHSQLGKQLPTQGMTSPQDVTVNEMKNLQMMNPNLRGITAHQRDVRSAINPGLRWMPSNNLSENMNKKAQIKPFTVELANNNQIQFAAQNLQQEILPRYQQQQQHYISADQRNMTNQNAQNVIPQNHNNHYQSLNPQSQMQDHQNLSAQNQTNFYQYTPSNRQESKKSSPAPQLENQEKQAERNKTIQFTPDMIRDQELLVATMRQQGIPDDIMRRQFDSLLNQQRRHLLYVEQLHNEDKVTETKKVEFTVRRKKQTDEKPEWMIHITPPRISYTEMESLKGSEGHKRLKSTEDQNDENIRVQQTVQHESEMFKHQIPFQGQPNYQFWQQPNYQYRNVNTASHNNHFRPYSTPVINNRNHSSTPAQNPPMMYQQYYQNSQNIPHYQYAQYAQQQPYNPQLQQVTRPAIANQKQNPTNDSNVEKNITYEEKQRTLEPCSLLKMRVYKEVIRPQKRNNGLQDAEIARKAMETLKNAENKKGLEYLDKLASKNSPVRLNGIQDRNETDYNVQEHPSPVNAEFTHKRIAANGLENTRNPNNPRQRRLSSQNKLDEEMTKEYPRQKQGNPRNCYSMQAERENGTVAVEQQSQNRQLSFSEDQLQGPEKPRIPYNEKNPMTARCNVMPFGFDVPYNEYYRQMQQYYENVRNLAKNKGEGDVGSMERNDMENKENTNRAGGDAGEAHISNDGRRYDGNKITLQPYGDTVQRMNYSLPEIHEARTIGGVKYLARKQNFIPNPQMISPDTLIANRYLQTPVTF